MVPLSSAQLGHWFAQKLDPSAILNGGQYVEIQGPVNPGLFEATLRKVIQEAETLRLCFIEGADGPRQFILPPEPWQLPYFDLTTELEPLAAAKKWMLEDLSRQPNLASGPLFGFALFKLGSESFLWYQRYHHLVTDGFGRSLITKRAAEIYTAYLSGASETASSHGSLEAFLEEDAAYRNSEQYVRDREYWLSVFRDSPQTQSLSRRPVAKSIHPLRRSVHLSVAQKEKLHSIGQRVGASLPQMLTAIAAGYVSRMTGAVDFTIGFATQNRFGSLSKQTALVTSNILPLRIQLSRESSLLDVAQQVSRRMREGFRHQRYRIEELRRDLGLFAPTERLFWPAVNYQSSASELSFAGHSATTHSIRQPWAEDLSITMYDESSGHLEINFDASNTLYDSDELENYLMRFVRLLETAAENPDQAVASLDLCMAEERRQMLLEWRSAERSLPASCMEELFEEHARLRPDAPAVICGEKKLSYRELNQRANQLARHLRTLGVERESRVAICLEQGAEMVVATLAVLKAGGAYVPLDIEHPPQRLAYMLEDSGARVLITERKLKPTIGEAAADKQCLQVDAPEIITQSGENLTLRGSSESLVYVMYTSGSTGKPKGTAIAQRAIVRLLRETDYIKLGPGDRIAQLANTSFDAATFEVWGALLNGGTVVMVSHDVALLPTRLAAALRQFKITTLFLTTALFNEVARQDPSAFSGLRDLLFGGEAVDPNCVRSVLEHGAPARLLHVYGPTENTTFSSWHHVTRVPAEAATVPIGKAIANTRAYVLDRALQVAPTGAVGELYLAGKGLSRGYWNRAALTAERFIPDPFGNAERMYRTGDLVRRLLDGSLEFIGRTDDQLKIRGFRVEIGEIEVVLRALKGVRDAVVVEREAGAEKRLAGYVVPVAGQILDANTIRQQLAQKIPNYMVPAVILILDALPLNANGKVDRQALPDPIFALAADYCPPRTPQEELLCNIFANVLGQESVGIEHNFFGLGGNSLLATRLVSQVRAVFGVEIAIRNVFEESTVAALARHLSASGTSRPSLESRSRPREIPLSYAQSRLWFIDQLEGSSTEYNMPYVLRLHGQLDREALQQAVNLIVQRHESLRTRFVSVDGNPVQVVDPELHISVAVEDLTSLEPALQARKVESTLRQEWKQPFDLARGPLLRMKLLQLSEQEHILLRTTHHIVFDGWSHGIFNRELTLLYEACAQKKENPLQPLPVQYADFSLWQRGWLNEQWLEPGLNYWKKQLAGIPERLELPRDRARPPLQTFHGERCHFTLNFKLVNSLRQISRENDATLYMALLAAFQLLLSRYSGQEDIVIGSPIANRQEARLEGLIGFFVNSLVMRGRLDPQMTVRGLLGQTRRTALEAFENQDVPFERLVEELVPDRSLDATPLFQVAFALQNAPTGVQRLKGLEIEPVVSWEPRVRFDMEVHVFEQATELECQWIYNRDLFDRWRIEQMARHYQRLLENMVQKLDRPLLQLEMLTSEESYELLHAHNGTARPLPVATLPELFERQVQQTPDADALIFEDQSISYLELNQRANRLARKLIASGVEAGSLVAVRMDRSPHLVVGLLAILKAGAAYVPLDLAYPRQRVMAMLVDSRATLLLTTTNVAQEMGSLGIPTILADSAAGEFENANLAPRRTHPSALAYVMHTSGSTGIPKGIAVSHEAIIRLVRETVYVTLRPGDRIAQVANASFDAATFEIWGALLNGGVAVVISRETTLSPPVFARVLEEQHINVLFLTTALFNQIAAEVPKAFSTVRDLLFGGEAVDPHWVRQVLSEGPPRRLLHVYGPTENTTFSTWHCVNLVPEGASTVPIGRPIENTRVYVLDGSLQPVPTGGVGELYVAGAGLAQGYLNRPVQTAERFVAEPYGSEAGGRMYRTGDLVRWNPQGALEFVGRADHQVKLRGFRVEMGEIESALKAYPGVKDALVTVREYDGQKQLLGYVVAQQGATQEADAATSHIVHWQQLYHSLYQQGSVDEFSLVGWNSSYTDGPIPSEEMQLWVKETVSRLTRWNPKRVLEIGCGTGLLLTRLASRCEVYVGLDFSEEVLKKLGGYIAGREELRHVELRQGLAHDLSFAAENSFDLVILNSVVQYFPDIDYLMEVLSQAVRVTQTSGHIFVGDVRSLPLHEAYHASVQLGKVAPQMAIEDFRQHVYHALRNDKELVVDPVLFNELQRCSDKVGRAEIALKVEDYDNELSRFRYDVTLTLGKKERTIEPEHQLSWGQADGWRQEVENFLQQQPGKSVMLRGVKDRRVAAAVEIVQLLHVLHDGMFNVAQLRAASEAVAGEDPHQMAAWAQRMGIDLCWQGFNSEGIYDAIFNPEWREAPAKNLARDDWRQYGNAPARSASIATLGRTLQEILRQSLPEYMVPAAIMALPSWPLNANGKVDRQKLPLPDRSSEDYRAPRTAREEVLCEIFAEILAIDRIGIDDNFFNLGGHSLMAMRLINRVRAVLGVEVALRTLFEAQTVAELSSRLDPAEKLRPPLTPQKRPEHLPLSYAQQRLWFLDQLEGTSTEYNMPEALRLRGELDRGALEKAVQEIVNRHEDLRTRFAEIHGEAVQIVEPVMRIEIPLEDLSALPKEEQSQRVATATRQEWQRAFDLSRGPLLRLKLLKLGSHEYVLLRTFHHIVSDGWSLGVFNREFMLLYDAFRSGQESPLEPLSVQYADFALWQRAWLEESLSTDILYWKEQLKGIPDRLDLPKDRPRPHVQTFQADRYQLPLSEEQVESLKRLSHAQQATLYMTMLSAFAILLARYSAQDDIVVGSPIANRQEAQLEKLIGFFVNSLVMRVRLRPRMTFLDLMAEVRQTTLAAYQHQDMPFERLVEELSPERSLNTRPIFQVVFALQNVPHSHQRLAGLEVESIPGSDLRVRVDLEVHAFERDGKIRLQWFYNSALFDRWRIEQMARHYVSVLDAVVANAQRLIEEIELLDERDRHHILQELNLTDRLALNVTLPELFEIQVEKTPENSAVAFGKESLTYRQLDERADRLAQFLIADGIGPEDIVGLALPRSLDLIVAILGILKSGAAYLPLDPEHPVERLRFTLQDARPRAVLTIKAIAAKLPEIAKLLVLDQPEMASALSATLSSVESKNKTRRLDPRNSAYVIYTSGSTGKPKGVVVTHAGIPSLAGARVERLHLSPSSRVLQFASINFDVAVVELIMGLTTGATLVLLQEDQRSGLALREILAGQKITHALLPPAVLPTMEPGADLSLESLVVGGEQCPAEVIAHWAPGRKMVNAYGPTETTVCATMSVPLSAGELPAIGTPIWNTRAYVLDEYFKPVPLGVPGELYLSGPGLARGYLNRTGFTAERFVANPYAIPGSRMYRTGDTVRWRADGNLEFLGRKDQQVKIRGFRIELGEIEAAFLSHEQVQEAIVMAREDGLPDKQLVAYVIPRHGEAEKDRERAFHVTHWQQLYDSYWQGPDTAQGDFNLAGWKSSYTGEPIAPEEMRVWVEETVNKLREMAARRVIEVGCGTGLLLTRLAGAAESYIGLDFSSQVLRQLETYMAKRADLRHVQLRRGLADDLSFAPDSSVDLVILNSITQYFPDIDYVVRALSEAVRVTRPGGQIFVGDVRSLSLLRAFQTAVQLGKAPGDASLQELRQHIARALRDEEELAIDPAFFSDVVTHWEKVGRVDVALKPGGYDNELSQFRYDVAIHLGEKESIAAPDFSLAWDAAGQWKNSLQEALARIPETAVGVRGIHNRRLSRSMEAVRLLDADDQDVKNVEQLRASIAPSGDDPNDVMLLARRLNTDISFCNAGTAASYDVIFRPRWVPSELNGKQPAVDHSLYANTPWQNQGNTQLGLVLQRFVREILPEYMVPATVMVLEKFPRTIQGKVDRQALPSPDVRSQVYRAPRTPVEEIVCSLYCEVLGLERVGIDDNFFELGGHSLLAARLVSRIRGTLGMELPLRTLFEMPTVAGISDHLVSGQRKHPALKAGARPQNIPLSYAQSRLWFIDRLEGGSSEYNMPQALRLRGNLNYAALENAMNAIVERHESLRTHFAEVDGEPVQLITRFMQVELPIEDLSRLDEKAKQDRIAASIRQEWEQPFGLAQGPLLRVKLLKLDPRDHILLSALHHIVSDGWSQGVFQQELAAFYEAFSEGREDPLPPLPLQYADYALWQRSWLDERSLSGSLEYWKKQLSDIPDELPLPKDRPRLPIQTFAAGACHAKLPGEQLKALERLGLEQHSTLYMTLLAAFEVLLARYSSQDDIVLGSPIANRQEPEVEGLIGLFLNSLVLRVRVNSKMSFRALLNEVRRTALEAYQHQDLPFERLVEEISPARSLNTSPIFQVVFALQNAPMNAQQLKGLEVEAVGGGESRARYDLELHAFEREGLLRMQWVYNRDLFDRWRIEQMARHYLRLLEAMIENIDQPVWTAGILTSAEQRNLLEEWNNTKADIPADNLARLFEEQARKTPNTEAVVLGGRSLSYAELNQRANQLAHVLLTRGVRGGELVAVCLEQGIEMVIALLAIIKTGAAYVPLDPEYPPDRLGYMMADSGVKLVLTRAKLLGKLPQAGTEIAWQDIDAEPTINLGAENPSLRNSRNGLAYVMYTSGSTGLPKGIAIPHRAIVRLVRNTNYVSLGPGDRIAQLASTSFDAMTFEVWGPLLNGGTVVIVPHDVAITPLLLAHTLQEQRITSLFLTTALFNEIVREQPRAFANLRDLLVGGEALDPHWMREVLKKNPPARLSNIYGPTENTTFSVFNLITALSEEALTVPIGQAIANTRAYVLDKNLQLTPVGVDGELYLAGEGLAWGYWRQAGLTAERFVADPYSGAGSRMYRTGDLARWREDGTLEFIGRADNQVKIRGFRVELGEIEAAFRTAAQVGDVAVILREDQPGEKLLVGYVVPATGESVDTAALHRHLSRILPKYMVPAAVVVRDSLPLTLNGKVDRKSLPAPDHAYDGYRAPRTSQEEILCELFSEVLGVDRAGIDSEFFELGGHSLLATRLVSRIRSTLGVEISIRMLFESPTVGELSERLLNKESGVPLERSARPPRLPLSYAQQRLWFIDRLEGGSTEYNVPEALRLGGKLDQDALEHAINTILERHESLRTHFEEIDGEAVQVVDPCYWIEIPVTDLTGFESAQQAELAKAMLRDERWQAFELQHSPMLRVKLLKLGEQDHILLRTTHHIASDGWSEAVFHREFQVLYEAYAEKRENPLPPLPVQYADFAVWQRCSPNEKRLSEGLEYWKKQLEGLPEELELPRDHSRGKVQTFDADLCYMEVKEELAASLKRLARESRSTLYMMLLAGFAALLQRYSGQEDIVVGTPVANRQDALLEQLIGFFVNSLVMRVRVNGRESFRNLLEEVKKTALEAYQHEDVPFERLVEELSPERSLNMTPIFQVLFVLQNTKPSDAQLKGLSLERVAGDELRVHYDLEVHAREKDGKLGVTWLYNRDLFDRWRMEQMARHYVRMLEAIVERADQSVSSFDLLREEERQVILCDWNNTATKLPGAPCIHELFEQQVLNAPDQIAVVDSDRELTYAELNQRANQTARFLQDMGVKTGERLVILLERSIDLVVAELATLKCGAAYVPVDPSLGVRRKAFMMAESRAKVMLCSSSAESPQLPGVERVNIDEMVLTEKEVEDLHVPVDSEAAAYVMFTSGSTGEPKGIVVPHRAIKRLVLNNGYAKFEPNDRVAFAANPAFDASTMEVWAPLLHGGRIVVIDQDTLLDPARFGNALKRHGVTVLWLTVGLFNQYAEVLKQEFANLRYLIVGGDALDPVVIARTLEGNSPQHLINGYGPTEATTFSVTHAITSVAENARGIPIGRPISNTQVYILDGYEKPVPIGVAGELYIGGMGLAHGYLNRSDLTAERFVPDPFTIEAGMRLYRTGDLGQWRHDGTIEFLGRNDYQLKIRGYRVELGEIEARLAQQPGVREAVVMAWEDEPGEKRLVGYVVASEGAQVDAEDARRSLREDLPEYMVPEAVMVLESLPITANGKLDRKKLPRVERQAEGYKAPRTPQEEVVSLLFAELLGLERVGVEDNFFHLGGHSLLAMRLAGRIRATLGVELEVRQIFEFATVEQLAEYIASQQQPSLTEAFYADPSAVRSNKGPS